MIRANAFERAGAGLALRYPSRHMVGALGIAKAPRSLRMPPELAGLRSVVMGGRATSGQFATGSGFADTPGLATAKAVGEFVERYSLLGHRSPSIPAPVSRNEISVPALRAEEMPYFNPDQTADPEFPWRGLRNDDPHQWTWCQGLGGAQDCLVPADLVWLDRPSPIAMLGSTGASAHHSLDDALLGGLLELIERDALSIMWECRATTPLICCDAAQTLLPTGSLLERLRDTEQIVYLRDLTTDLEIPVVAAVLVDAKGRRPALTMGAAARLSFSDAIDAAITEAAAVWVWMRDEHARLELSLAEVVEHARHPTSPKWQAILYGFTEMLAAASPLTTPAALSHRPTCASNSFPATLEQVVATLAARGIPCWWTSILPPELVDSGWTAIRVVAPGLAPLGFGERCRPIGHPRVQNVARSCGWPHRIADAQEYRPPIPLP